MSKSAGFIFPLAHGDSSSFLCLEPRNSRKLKKQERDDICRLRCGGVIPRLGLREPLLCHESVAFPPFLSPRLSRPAIQLGSVGTHSRLRRATRAAGEPDASSSAEVKHELYNHTAVRCRLLCRAAYLKTPKYEGKGGEKTKDTTLKYQQKRACVQMIIKGCLTPSPPAPSADLKSTICSRELLSAS